MTSDLTSTFTAMAKETADKVGDQQADFGGLCEYRKCIQIIEAALHAVAALQREQDAKVLGAFALLYSDMEDFHALGAKSDEAAELIATRVRQFKRLSDEVAAIRATPETPTSAKPYAATLSCGERFHVHVVGASRCNCGKLATPETPR